jgi:hypothetical protein
MKTSRNGNATKHAQTIDDVVAVACHLAGTDEIRAVHVISGERPTYSEVLRYRHWADVSHLSLRVEAASLSFRSRERDDDQSSVEEPWTSSWPHHFRAHGPWRAVLNGYSHGVMPALAESSVGSTLGWLSAHGKAWYSELTLMSEGTR